MPYRSDTAMRETLLLVLLLLPALLEAYPGGAGTGACGDFFPRHGASAATQQFPSIFSITVDSTSYSANQEIKVTLRSVVCGRSFKGFLVQARPADPSVTATEGIGSFVNFAPGSQGRCDRVAGTGTFAVTHTSKDPKDSIEVTWKAPSAAAGHVVIAVTFVESYSNFWVEQKSEIIQDSTLTGNPSYPNIPSAVQSPVACSTGLVKPSGCGSTMGCYHDCNGNSCTYIVTWASHADHVAFTIKSTLPGITSGYVAIGLSEDQKMGSDGVTECVLLNNAVTVHNSENTGRSNKRMTTTVATEGTGTYTDGTLSCSFELPLGSNTGLLDVQQDRYLLFVKGTSVSADNLQKHTTRPVASAVKVDFQKNEDVTGSSSSDLFVKLHGSLMVVAWIFAASLGIVIARYFKPQWPENTCCGEKVWFQMHRSFMTLVFLAAATAFVLIFVDVQGYSDLGQEASKKAHPILGIIVTALMVINPIMAIFRPHPNEPNRPIFNWAHFGVGSAAHILAVVTIFLGVNLGRLAIPSYVTWILVGYVAWQVLMEFLLVFVRCKTESKDRRESYEMAQKGQLVNRQRETKSGSSPARQILLLAHAIAITALATAIIVCIIIS